MNTKRLFCAGLLLVMLVLAISSCQKVPENETVDEAVASSIILSQANAEMLIGETVQLHANILPTAAKDRPILWASSKKSVAIVSDQGLVEAIAEGSATITATVDGVSATCEIVVIKGDVQVESVSLDYETLALNKGESALLKVTVLPADATDPKVNWSSSDPSVAEVDQTGKVTAKNGGTTIVIAKAGLHSAECEVVVSVPVEFIQLDPQKVDLKVGETATVSAIILPEDATDKEVIWTSSDEAVVTVDRGQLSAISAGKAVITAQCGLVSAACEVSVEPAFKGLCLEAIQAGTITIDSSPMSLTVEYSKDAVNWTSETSDYIYINLKEGECVYLRGDNKAYARTIDGANYVTSIHGTAPFYAYGNVLSLVDSKYFESVTSLTEPKALSGLFNDSSNLYSHPEKKLLLPATELSDECYSTMFYGCTHLTEAPDLPATVLAEGCYLNMFNGCSELKRAPELPAKDIYPRCYGGMFWGCTSLVDAPVLPATKVAVNSYASMFRDCTSLKSSPALPATVISENCYMHMFQGCTALETTPSLPAEKMETSCYAYMFYGCTNLKRYTTGWLPAKDLAEYCYQSMFYDCISLESAPSLPALQMAKGCYYSMFSGCSSLKSAPTLSSTALAEQCYAGMFRGCSSLKTAPELPAMELAINCYSSMFRDCTSLTTAPTLPALTLVQSCYYRLFYGCSNLTSITALFLTEPSTAYTKEWVEGVPDSGWFYINRDANWYIQSNYAIPFGWNTYYVDL